MPDSVRIYFNFNFFSASATQDGQIISVNHLFVMVSLLLHLLHVMVMVHVKG
jgi:hypothetical protein